MSRLNYYSFTSRLKAQLSLSEQERNKAESIVNIQAQVSVGENSTIQSDLETLAGETDPLSCKAIAQGQYGAWQYDCHI